MKVALRSHFQFTVDEVRECDQCNPCVSFLIGKRKKNKRGWVDGYIYKHTHVPKTVALSHSHINNVHFQFLPSSATHFCLALAVALIQIPQNNPLLWLAGALKP